MYELHYRLIVLYRRIICFFIGHGELWDYSPYDMGPWCPRCDILWPMDELTIPSILNGIYAWLCGRRWDWFDRFDGWLLEKYPGRLPNWWEY